MAKACEKVWAHRVTNELTDQMWAHKLAQTWEKWGHRYMSNVGSKLYVQCGVKHVCPMWGHRCMSNVLRDLEIETESV